MCGAMRVARSLASLPFKHLRCMTSNGHRSTSVCQDVAYNCQLTYTWSLRGAQGQHTVTFKSYDWMGNVGVLTATVTVS